MTQSASTAGAESAAAPLFQKLLPLGMLLVLGALWGLAFSLAKISRTNGVPPLGHAFWQASGAGLILYCVCWARGIRPALSRAHIRYYLFAGLIGFAGPNANMVFTLNFVPVGVMAVMITTVPVITYILAIALRMERLAAMRALGVAFGLGGALLILLPSTSLPDPAMAVYAAIGLITPLLYAVANIGMARWRPQGRGGHSLSLACGMTIAAGVGLCIAMLATGQTYLLGEDGWQLRDTAIAGQALITAVAFGIFFELLRMVGPVVAGAVGFAVTTGGILWGIAIFGETHSVWVWGAVVLVLIGLVLVNTPTGSGRIPKVPAG